MIYYISQTLLKHFQITLVKQAVHPKFTPEVETDIYISDNSNIELNKCFESAKEFSTLTIQLTNHLLIVSVQYTGIGEFYTNCNIETTYLFLKKKKKKALSPGQSYF